MTNRRSTLLMAIGIAGAAWNLCANEFKLGVGTQFEAAKSRLFTFSIETPQLDSILVEQKGGLKLSASTKSASEARPQRAAVEVSLKQHDESCDIRVNILSRSGMGDNGSQTVLNESRYTVALPRSGLESLFLLSSTNGTYKPNEPLTLGTLQGRPLKLTVAQAKRAK